MKKVFAINHAMGFNQGGYFMGQLIQHLYINKAPQV